MQSSSKMIDIPFRSLFQSLTGDFPSGNSDGCTFDAT